MTESADAETTSNAAEQVMLDAARAEFERYGVRRTNMDDIARRAGVSRSTLYRRFPSKDALFAQLVRHGAEVLFAQLDSVAANRDPHSAVVECFVVGIQLFRETQLAGRIMESEPEMLLGLATRSGGMSIPRASGLVAKSLRRSGATMSDEDLGAVSEILIRITASLIQNREGQLDISDPEAVRRYAERYLSRLVW
ncbi:TetR/AcrR family transcriptional regulator [Nocardia goodfellowii]|uniref:AcrR family transcriptional regulator n=1 Tax=Nocardia goodfellowii TaxID=882446 RepID=A0ABS4QIT4_9NOCA|nr:TetR/AcrR family transcriptional regulator [Nocardia goodfellowii]MBP2191614.1 AcrR family transcriptional regulator [Nocardia goodfellowii]